MDISTYCFSFGSLSWRAPGMILNPCRGIIRGADVPLYWLSGRAFKSWQNNHIPWRSPIPNHHNKQSKYRANQSTHQIFLALEWSLKRHFSRTFRYEKRVAMFDTIMKRLEDDILAIIIWCNVKIFNELSYIVWLWIWRLTHICTEFVFESEFHHFYYWCFTYYFILGITPFKLM